MNIKGKFVVMCLAVITLFSTVSVSAATWTTAEVKGSSYTSGLLNYGDGTRYLHARGISGTGNIKMYKVIAYQPDKKVAEVDTKVGVSTVDTWTSESKTNNGTRQSYYYKWTGNSKSAAANMRVSDY